MSIGVRPATLGDYAALVALFDELDEFHRLKRPDFFRPFEGPARSWAQVGQWLAGPGTTVLVAEGEAGVVGLAVLLTRPPAAFAGAVPRKVIELDNLVVRADWRGQGVGKCLLAATMDWSREQGLPMSKWPCMPLTAIHGGFTSVLAFLRPSSGLSWRHEQSRSTPRDVVWCFPCTSPCRTNVHGVTRGKA